MWMGPFIWKIIADTGPSLVPSIAFVYLLLSSLICSAGVGM